jgi:hypothetical protein
MLGTLVSERSIEGRLNAFLARHAAFFATTNLPPCLYRYTSSTVLRAIISSGVIRAYNLGQMTDFVEGKYAASVMRAHIDRAFAVEESEDARRLFRAMRRQLTTMDLSPVFALSFSTNGSEPGMWELYADEGRGFSFAIPIDRAFRWVREELNGFAFRCSYSPSELDQFCKAALETIRHIYRADCVDGLAHSPDSCAELFLSQVAWFAPVFKPHVFEAEQEWRFLFVRPPNDHKVDADGRTFIELPLSPVSGVAPIRAICAGPHADYDDDIVPLQDVLCSNGYGADFPVHIAAGHSPGPGRRSPIMRSAA